MGWQLKCDIYKLVNVLATKMWQMQTVYSADN